MLTQSGAPGFSSFRAVMDLSLGFADTLIASCDGCHA